jgi:Flp pilus assembly pilin Flp
MEVIMRTNILKKLIYDESGQGITEYGAILSFISILVALMFSISTGGMKSAISNAFSCVVSVLNTLIAEAS